VIHTSSRTPLKKERSRPAPRRGFVQESTILALNNVFYHWGAIIVPVGYTDPSVFAAGGNPYGTTNTASQDGSVTEEVLAAARHQGARLARFTALIAQSRVTA
jgi:NAD(P)H dehydrogenase (quinone)